MPDDTFRTFILDQLSALGQVDCQRMFGSYGLYHDGVFFGIVSQGQVYFKTDPLTRAAYCARGMQPFRPNARQTLTSYYAVPVDILEDSAQLAAWARQAITCQTRARAARRPAHPLR
ncbi:MAG: TfoX/Sxy family protein [Candidatus Tectimicrobiota bacterium]